MEFQITKTDIEKENIERYEQEAREIAEKFAKKARKEFGDLVKVIALFGSAGTRKMTKKSDVDILVVVDDITIVLTKELIETYRLLIEKIVAEISPKLHITSMRLSSYWEYIRNGDPVIINILRTGWALIDTGIFAPFQLLLKQGRIRPSQEAMWNYYVKSPVLLNNAKWNVMNAVLDLYWAVIDSAHAALMKLGHVPPSPDHIADMLEEKMVKKGILKPKYVKIMRNFYKIQKMIVHREIKEISGLEYDRYLKDAEEFVEFMRLFIENRIV